MGGEEKVRKIVQEEIRRALPELARELAAQIALILNRSGWEIYVPITAETLNRLEQLIKQLSGTDVDLRESVWIKRLRTLARANVTETELKQIISYHAWRCREDSVTPWQPKIFDPKEIERTLTRASQRKGEIIEWARMKLALVSLASQLDSRLTGSSGTSGGDTGG